MSLDRRLLDILACPSSHQPVVPLNGSQLDAINRAIGGGGVTDVEGRPLSGPLKAGLLTRDGKLVYRVEDGIPVMLASEAIATLQVPDFPG